MLESCNPGENRVAFADWVELKALVSRNGTCSASQLVRSQATLSDGDDHGPVLLDFDRDNLNDVEEVDSEIIDGESEELAEIASSELRYRAKTLDDLYPFQLEESSLGWILRVKQDQVHREIQAARWCYIACLLMSGMRGTPLKTIAPLAMKQELERIFQRISWMNAGAVLGGETFWLGYPRPNHSDLHTAMKQLQRRMGLGRIHPEWPEGVSRHSNDGGLDVVAWKRFRDSRGGGIVLLGQVASGANWPGKSALSTTGVFRQFWLQEPATSLIPAMFIPFVKHSLISENERSDFDTFAWSNAYMQEREFGLVVDRLRLTELTVETFKSLQSQRASFKDIRPVIEWLRDALKLATS